MPTFVMRAIALCFAIAPAVASADRIIYTYAVPWSSGALAGTMSSGQFYYDTAIVVPNTTQSGSSLLSGLDFSIGSKRYDISAISGETLQFDSLGHMTQISFGTSCRPGCVVGGLMDDWFVSFYTIFYPPVAFSAVRANGDLSTSSTIIWSVTAVPEPTTIALLVTGLLFVLARSKAARVARRKAAGRH